MKNNIFLQINVEIESQNSSKLINIHSTSQRKDCLNVLHLWVRQLLTTGGNVENPPNVKSWTSTLVSEQALLSPHEHSAVLGSHHAQLWNQLGTAANSTSCHCQHPSPLTPALGALGAPHQLLARFWGLQSRIFLLAGFSLKLSVDVRELKERGSIFKAILWAQNESSGTAWSEEQRCPHVNTHSL